MSNTPLDRLRYALADIRTKLDDADALLENIEQEYHNLDNLHNTDQHIKQALREEVNTLCKLLGRNEEYIFDE